MNYETDDEDLVNFFYTTYDMAKKTNINEHLLVNACYNNDLSYILSYIKEHEHNFKYTIINTNIFLIFIKYLDNITFEKLFASYNFDDHINIINSKNISDILNIFKNIDLNNTNIINNIKTLFNHINKDKNIFINLYAIFIDKTIKSYYDIKSETNVETNYEKITYQNNINDIRLLILSKIMSLTNILDSHIQISIPAHDYFASKKIILYNIKIKYVILLYEDINQKDIINLLNESSFNLDEAVSKTFIYPLNLIIFVANINIIDKLGVDKFIEIINYIVYRNNIYNKQCPYFYYLYCEQFPLKFMYFMIEKLDFDVNIKINNNQYFIHDLINNILYKNHNFYFENILKHIINMQKINYSILDDKFNNIIMHIFHRLYGLIFDNRFNIIFENDGFIDILKIMIKQNIKNINFKNLDDESSLYLVLKLYKILYKECLDSNFKYIPNNTKNKLDKLILFLLENGADIYDNKIMKNYNDIIDHFMTINNTKSAIKSHEIKLFR